MTCITVAALAVPAAPPVVVRAQQAIGCGDVQIVYARGANFAPGGDDFKGFVTDSTYGLRSRIGPGISVAPDYQLGKDGGFGGHVYTPSGDLDVLGGPAVPFPYTGGDAYYDEVREGKAELEAFLSDRASACASEVFVLAGWSEGANTVGESLQELPRAIRDRIAFVALFGDPKLDSGNFRFPFGLASLTLACNTPPLWRRWSDCTIPGGFFEARIPYIPDDISPRVGSWCADQDAACDGKILDLPAAFLDPPYGNHAHRHYFLPGAEMAQAAREAAEALTDFMPLQLLGELDVSYFAFVGRPPGGADLAVVIDSTGSMAGVIDDAKSIATDLANRWLLMFPRGRVAVVEFRDVGDIFVARVDQNFTDNINNFQNAVNGLVADGGGDTPEAQLSGVMTALDQLAWQPGATKAEIVITDAPGKDPDPANGLTREQVAQHAREIDPVAIFGVDASGGWSAVTDFMTPLATGTGGQVFVLQSGQSLADALFAVLDVVNTNPVATLNGPYRGEPGTAIRFTAYGSFDADASLVSYEWDFDNDGIVDQTTSTPFVDHAYASEFHGVAVVRVVSSDGDSALASAQVDVLSSQSLADVAPLTPLSASAFVSGPDSVTVTWVPATSDRADGYFIYLSDGTPVAFRPAAGPDQVEITSLDLSQPVVFDVVASNGYGNSAPVETDAVGGSPWMQSIRVNDDSTTNEQDAPAVAVSPDGATYAVWQDFRSFTRSDIYFARRDPATGAWSANQRINDSTAGPSDYQASIGVDGSNNAYAVWSDGRNSGHGSDYDVYFSKRPMSGAWSANGRVNDDRQGSGVVQTTPRIAVNAPGAAVAVWEDQRGSNQDNIYSSRLAAGGTTWAANLRVTSNTSAQKRTPDIAVAPDGTAYAVWSDARNGNYDIWFASLAPGGTSWSTNVRVSDDPGSAAQTNPRIGIDGAGNLVVSWLDGRTTNGQIRVSRREPRGSWSASQVVSDAAAKPASASLTVASDGREYVAWQDARGASWDVWGSEYSPSPGTWSTPDLISDSVSGVPDVAPSVAYGTSTLALAWSALRTGGGTNYDVFARQRR